MCSVRFLSDRATHSKSVHANMKPIYRSFVSQLWAAILLRCMIVVAARGADFPNERWSVAAPNEVALDAAKLNEARDYALTGGGSGYIVRGGKLVLSWGDPA